MLRTVRCSGSLPGGCLPGQGVSAWLGGCLPGGCLPRGMSAWPGRCLPGQRVCLLRGVCAWPGGVCLARREVYTSPPWTDRQLWKYITFPQLLLRTVKIWAPLTKSWIRSCRSYNFHFVNMFLWHSGISVVYYRPQTKLRECNVFTRLCHSVRRGGGNNVTSCLVPCSFWGVWSRGGGGSGPGKGSGPGVGKQHPPPRNHKSEWYTSYWNAFLLREILLKLHWKDISNGGIYLVS